MNQRATGQRVLMRRGSIGEIRRGRQAFTAEVRALAHLLNQPVGQTFQYFCDAAFGDARCGLDITGPTWRGNGVVSATEGIAGSAWRARQFRGRVVRFRGGGLDWRRKCRAAGRDRDAHTRGRVATITLFEAPCGQSRRRRGHDHRGLRQAPCHLQGPVRQCGELPRLSLYPGR